MYIVVRMGSDRVLTNPECLEIIFCLLYYSNYGKVIFSIVQALAPEYEVSIYWLLKIAVDCVICKFSTEWMYSKTAIHPVKFLSKTVTMVSVCCIPIS